MAFEFKLPDVGEGLSEGEIVEWHVKEGESVKQDQHLVDILTDKATVEITSPKEGSILKILAKPGEKIQVGEVIVVIGALGEAHTLSGNAQLKHAAQSAPASSIQGIPNEPSQAQAIGVMATPNIRKLAKDLGVTLENVRGTGPGGRILEENVRAALAPSRSPAPSASFGPEERVPFIGIRRKTALKMTQSFHSGAPVTHIDEVDMSRVVELHEQLKKRAQEKGIRLTYLAYALKATGLCLKDFPYFNASLDEVRQEIILKRYVNIGVAVAAPQGLFTPIVRDCDKKNLLDIAREIDLLSAKAKEGKLQLNELQGGTFTITNIGSIGGLAATPIINYPEVAILALFKIVKKPVVAGGEIVIRDTMNLGLTFDHRVQDGADAAKFTNAIIEKLENPSCLLYSERA